MIRRSEMLLAFTLTATLGLSAERPAAPPVLPVPVSPPALAGEGANLTDRDLLPGQVTLSPPARARQPHAASRSSPRPPVPREGIPQREPSDPTAVSGDVLDVTAYCWTGNRTASGVWPEPGMAAGNDWPFGTRLLVESVGQVTITDRYGSGTQLDIYLGRGPDCQRQAAIFGRRQLHVEVIR